MIDGSHYDVVADERSVPVPEAGATLGPYRIISRLGAGGMATVFRAEEAQTGRSVALKIAIPIFTGKETIHAVANEYASAETVTT